jgi:hypothetical protein
MAPLKYGPNALKDAGWITEAVSEDLP